MLQARLLLKLPQRLLVQAGPSLTPQEAWLAKPLRQSPESPMVQASLLLKLLQVLLPQAEPSLMPQVGWLAKQPQLSLVHLGQS